MKYRVIFSPEAAEQLAELFHYIAAAASPGIAERYINAIISYCETLDTFPLRGAKRDDVRPGLQVTNYNGRTRASAFMPPSNSTRQRLPTSRPACEPASCAPSSNVG